jgi:hypothetical protein
MKKFVSLSLAVLLVGSSVNAVGLEDVTTSPKKLQDFVDKNVPGGEYLTSAAIGISEAAAEFYAAFLLGKAADTFESNSISTEGRKGAVVLVGLGAGHEVARRVEDAAGLKAKHPHLQASVHAATLGLLCLGVLSLPGTK